MSTALRPELTAARRHGRARRLRETIRAFAAREPVPHAEEREATTFPNSVFRRMGGMWELQGERLIGAAGAVAGAQKAVDQTLRYAGERQAFGRSIGRFQVTRYKFAEMATMIEAARQLVYVTARRFANEQYLVPEISTAKLYAARIASEVTDECLQIHGTAGYMQEYGIERAWRDMRLNRIGAGTDEIMLDLIGRSYGL